MRETQKTGLSNMAPNTPDIRMREFGFSEANIREGKWSLVALVLLGTSLGGVFLWYFLDARIGKALVAIGMHLLICVPSFALVLVLINRRLRKWKVLIYDDKLVKQCGKTEHTPFWKDVTGIKTVRNKSGSVVQIRLWTNKPKMSMCLGGFSGMDDLATLITARTPEGTELREKRYRLNWWQDALVGLLVMAVAAAVVMFILASIGSKAVGMFAILAVLSLGLGLFLLLFRPMTRDDLGFKWIELIVGIGMLIVGIYMLICLLATGRIL